MSAFVVPPEYGYVLATISGSILLNYFHIFLTGSARKAAKVDYPNAYATHEDASKDPAKFAFNCAQRAHQNFLEQLPIFLSTMLIGGLNYPVAMSVMGAAWIVGRVLYGIGYKNSPHNSTGQGRNKGAFAAIVQLPMLGLTLWSGYQFAMGL